MLGSISAALSRKATGNRAYEYVRLNDSMLHFNAERLSRSLQNRKTSEKNWIKQRRSAFWYSYNRRMLCLMIAAITEIKLCSIPVLVDEMTATGAKRFFFSDCICQRDQAIAW